MPLERLWGHPQADIHAGEWGEQIIPSTRRLMTSFPCFRLTHVETRNGIAVRLRITLDLSRPRDPNRYTSSRLDLAPRTRPCWHGQRKSSR
jgi:hypothetical protein